jgi:hypothetical protein
MKPGPEEIFADTEFYNGKSGGYREKEKISNSVQKCRTKGGTVFHNANSETFVLWIQ